MHFVHSLILNRDVIWRLALFVLVSFLGLLGCKVEHFGLDVKGVRLLQLDDVLPVAMLVMSLLRLQLHLFDRSIQVEH